MTFRQFLNLVGWAILIIILVLTIGIVASVILDLILEQATPVYVLNFGML